MEKKDRKYLARNKKAWHEYEIQETFEAGVVLTGTEIKSVRQGKVNLIDAYARIDHGEAWLYNAHIAPYEFGNRFNTESRRTRKLLLHRQEIHKLFSKTQQKGLTLIPLSMYLEHGYAKLELGLGRGKTLYDKRETLARKEAAREAERALSQSERD